MAKSKWSELKKDMGKSLTKARSKPGRLKLWRVEDRTPQPVRNLTPEEFEAKRRELDGQAEDDTQHAASPSIPSRETGSEANAIENRDTRANSNEHAHESTE